MKKSHCSRSSSKVGICTDDGQINLTSCLFASLPARKSSLPARKSSKFPIPCTCHSHIPSSSKTGKEPRRSRGSQYRLIAARHPRRRRNVSSLCNNRVSVLPSCGFDQLSCQKMGWIRWIFILWWRVCDFCCLASLEVITSKAHYCRFLCLPPFPSADCIITKRWSERADSIIPLFAVRLGKQT